VWDIYSAFTRSEDYSGVGKSYVNVYVQSKPKEDQEAVVDIDPNDAEVEMAATKIQASFKGFQARKKLKEVGAGECWHVVFKTDSAERKTLI